ncbi:hypothetical protein BJX63DRAFT_106959 [Aspergillus granulosus]|uniref:AAA+ ATPase domain-containing protein n=1 Tax=Aspergillus granulosus TaxID=176169 RepID=A0ABR4GU24_9EURO
MGSCRWKNSCNCLQGPCVTTTPSQEGICECKHLMADHEEYDELNVIPTPPAQDSPARTTEEPYIDHPVVERTELVKEILARLDEFRLVRINGTPASGKTTLMNLMIKHLLKESEGCALIYNLLGWERDIVRNAGGWKKYLKEQTGVDGSRWTGHSSYLFIDEAQQTYWDTELWAGLFRTISPGSKCRVLLLTSYGSPNKGLEGFDNAIFQKTPMIFEPEQQIALYPDYTVAPLFKPVGLLLDECEGMKLVGDLMKSRHATYFTGAITEDFKRYLWQFTQGYAGLIISFCEALGRLRSLVRCRHSDLDSRHLPKVFSVIRRRF